MSDGFEPWPAPSLSAFLWPGAAPPELPDAEEDESEPSVVALATAAVPRRNALIPTAATPVPSQALTGSSPVRYDGVFQPFWVLPDVRRAAVSPRQINHKRINPQPVAGRRRTVVLTAN